MQKSDKTMRQFGRPDGSLEVRRTWTVGGYLIRLATMFVAVVVVVAAVDVLDAEDAVEAVLLEAVELGVGLFGPFSALLVGPLLPGAL